MLDCLGFNSHQGQEIFLYSKMSRPALGPASSYPVVTGGPFTGAKVAGAGI